MRDGDGHLFRLEPALLRIDPTAFVASTAVLVGDVHVGPGASVWFGAVVRGDMERIRVGARTNLQDGTIVHADLGFPCLVGDDVTVGHRCILHGTTVGDGCLVGMGATLMNGSTVGPASIIAAGALLTEGKAFPGRSLILGAPARVVRPLTDDELRHVGEAAAHYAELGAAYRAAGFGSLPLAARG